MQNTIFNMVDGGGMYVETHETNTMWFLSWEHSTGDFGCDEWLLEMTDEDFEDAGWERIE